MIPKIGYEFLLLNHPFLLHCTSALNDIKSPCNRGAELDSSFSLECEVSHFPSLCFNWLRVAKVLRDETSTIPFM